jgi:hydrophobe/amphiphile efflux-3 (HAE3) family protein
MPNHAFSDKLVAFVMRHRVAVLMTVAAITLGLGFFIKDIEVLNDPTKAIPPTMPAYQAYQKIQKVLPSPRRLVCIAVFGDPLSLQARVDSLRAWGERFDAIEGIDNVFHLGSIRVPQQGGMFGLRSAPVVPRKGSIDDAAILKRVSDNGEFTTGLIAEEGAVLSMAMEVADSVDQSRVAEAAVTLVDAINHQGVATLHITGAPLYGYAIDKATRRTFAVILPICLIVVAALLFWVFRRVGHVLTALAVIGAALVCTFGLMGLSGSPFSVVSSVIPVILFPIGVASAIHIFKTYSREMGVSGGDRHEAIRRSYRELLRPIILSALTTFVGFFSFAFSDMPWTRNFGIFTAIGVVFSLLLSVIIVPIVLSYEKNPRVEKAPDKEGISPTARLWRAYHRFVFESTHWAVLAVAIVVIGVVGFLRVRIEGNPITMFPGNGDIRRTDELVGRYLGGTRFVNVLLERTAGDFTEAAAWADVRALIDYAEKQPLVGGSVSLLPMIERVSELLSDSSLSQSAVSMTVKSGSLLGKKLDRYIDSWVTGDRTTTRFILVCKNVAGTAYIDFARSFEQHVENTYPHLQATVAGSPIINNASTFVLIDTQRTSLIVAFALVFLVLWLIFHSPRTALIALTPILLSTLFVYGFMGIANVAINMVTVVIVNTCVGIGIDYAIHFVAGYLYIRRHTEGKLAALEETARRKGAVITFNTLVVGIGFLVLQLSSFPPIRHLGLFVFVSMVTSCAFSLVFLPVLLRSLMPDDASVHTQAEPRRIQ